MTNTDIIRGGYEAFARRDIPEVLARFSDEIVWTSPDSLPSGGRFRGKEAVLGFFMALPRWYDELEVLPETFIAAGDTVVVRGHHRMRIGAEHIEPPFVMVWTLHDGEVTEFHEYTDTARIARALEKKAALA